MQIAIAMGCEVGAGGQSTHVVPQQTSNIPKIGLSAISAQIVNDVVKAQPQVHLPKHLIVPQKGIPTAQLYLRVQTPSP
jgi:hypothetical protein